MLVKAILRQADGSFIGEVYGVTPRQRAVAVGDLVSFRESQIFTFKVDAKPGTPLDAETADMVRAFDASFTAAKTPAVSAPIGLDGFGAKDHEVTCAECGAILHFSRPRDESSAARKLRVACRNCGRINEIAEAQFASPSRD